MIAVGIGCKREASAAEIKAAVERALAASSLALADVRGLFTADFKAQQSALREAATALDMPITFVAVGALALYADQTHTRSAHVMERWGLPSVAETAALAGAHTFGGDKVRLLGPRSVHEGVTCALATQE